MQKIMILANNDVGLYKFRKELIEQLVTKYEVYIVLPDGSYIAPLVDLGCKFIDIKISRRGMNPLTDFKLLMQLIKRIKMVKPDVVLTYTIKPNIYGGLACQFTGVPYIANVTGLGSAVENGGLLQRITVTLYKMALRKAACVFFQNQDNAAFFDSHRVVRGRKRLIPGSGVNLEEYSLLDYPNDSTTHFLYIARVMKEKGIDQYLEAARYIKGKYPDTVFHVLGNCEEAYEDLLNQMHNDGVIQYHGMQSDVRKFHKISHCTIHPTYYPEGMSNVLLESAACGRPIITTNRAGCREIVDDGVNGYVVEQQSSEDLIEKIEAFINLTIELKEKMGSSSRRKVESQFDRNIVIQEYLSEISKV